MSARTGTNFDDADGNGVDSASHIELLKSYMQLMNRLPISLYFWVYSFGLAELYLFYLCVALLCLCSTRNKSMDFVSRGLEKLVKMLSVDRDVRHSSHKIEF